jgi:hypothetical protein
VLFSAELASNRDGPAELRRVHCGAIVSRQPLSLKADQLVRAELSLPMVTLGRTVWTTELAAVGGSP